MFDATLLFDLNPSFKGVILYFDLIAFVFNL